jgi:anti-sigma-K factor RskA
MEHQEYQEMLASHALDALDPSAARVLDEHLEGCDACRAELIELRDASGLLAHAATPVAPRAEVLDQILAKVRSEQPAFESDKTLAQVVAMPRRIRFWPTALRLAAAVAFVALLVWIIVLWRRDVRLNREIAQLTRQLSTEQRELVRDRDVLTHQREVLALLNAPGAKRMNLAGTQTAQTARASFVFDPQTGHAVLMTEGLPAAPADKAYELWFIPKGHAAMAGKMFTVDASGRAMVSDQIPPEARENCVIAITLEQKKGSAVPTGAIYLSSPST